MAPAKKWFDPDQKGEARKAAKSRGEKLFVKKGKTKDNPKVRVLGYYVGDAYPTVTGANTVEMI